MRGSWGRTRPPRVPRSAAEDARKILRPWCEETPRCLWCVLVTPAAAGRSWRCCSPPGYGSRRGPCNRHRQSRHRHPSRRLDRKNTKRSAHDRSALSDQRTDPYTLRRHRGGGNRRRPNWLLWILAPSKSGKHCEHSIWSASPRICPRSALTSVTCRRFPIAYASRRF